MFHLNQTAFWFSGSSKGFLYSKQQKPHGWSINLIPVYKDEPFVPEGFGRISVSKIGVSRGTVSPWRNQLNIAMIAYTDTNPTPSD